MKRYVESATSADDDLHPYFEGVPLPSCLEMTGTGLAPKFKYVGAYPEFGPRFSVEQDKDAKGRIWFVPTISMPECNGDQLDYYDSFIYLANRYAEVAQLATYFMESPLVLEDWEDEDEEDEEDEE